MLHNEARKLLIQALERSHNVREVARNYSVNRSTVYRLKKRLDETGSIETRTYLRGRKPTLSPEEVENINQLVKARPDITMQEIIETLHLTVSNETVRKTVRQLGYRRKKKSLHASEQERPRCGREEKRLERSYVWIFEVGAEVSPVFPPRLCDLGIFVVPVQRESLQSVQSGLLVHCCIDALNDAYEEMLKALLTAPDRPTAMLVSDDILAVVLEQFCGKLGLHIPKDLFIVSFNNSLFSRITSPQLTTVDVNPYQLGMEAASQTINHIENPNLLATKIIVPHRLILRESCCPPPEV